MILVASTVTWVDVWSFCVLSFLDSRISQLLLNFLLLSGKENLDFEAEYMDDYEVNVDNLNPGCSTSTEGEGSYMVQQVECSEDFDSDEDYSSIRK